MLCGLPLDRVAREPGDAGGGSIAVPTPDHTRDLPARPEKIGASLYFLVRTCRSQPAWFLPLTTALEASLSFVFRINNIYLSAGGSRTNAAMRPKSPAREFARNDYRCSNEENCASFPNLRGYPLQHECTQFRRDIHVSALDTILSSHYYVTGLNVGISK